MSNQINENWAEQQYQIQLDKMAGVNDEEKEIIKLQDVDPDYQYDLEKDNNL